MQKIYFLNRLGWKGNWKTGRNGNAAINKSSCGKICHMIGIKVCTSVDMTS
jgi:hypothetical protein